MNTSATLVLATYILDNDCNDIVRLITAGLSGEVLVRVQVPLPPLGPARATKGTVPLPLPAPLAMNCQSDSHDKALLQDHRMVDSGLVLGTTRRETAV